MLCYNDCDVANHRCTSEPSRTLNESAQSADIGGVLFIATGLKALMTTSEPPGFRPKPESRVAPLDRDVSDQKDEVAQKLWTRF